MFYIHFVNYLIVSNLCNLCNLNLINSVGFWIRGGGVVFCCLIRTLSPILMFLRTTYFFLSLSYFLSFLLSLSCSIASWCNFPLAGFIGVTIFVLSSLPLPFQYWGVVYFCNSLNVFSLLPLGLSCLLWQHELFWQALTLSAILFASGCSGVHTGLSKTHLFDIIFPCYAVDW